MAPDLQLQKPELDEKRIADLIDILATASSKIPEEHSESMLKDIFDNNVVYMEDNKMYYLGQSDLTREYLIRLRYMASEAGSRKVEIKTKAQLNRKALEDIVNKFASEKHIKLQCTEKKMTGKSTNMPYVAVTDSLDNELARLFLSKISFVHERFEKGVEPYNTALSLTARLVAELHRKDDCIQGVTNFYYSQYAIPLYLKIPGWFSKDYLQKTLDNFSKCIENPNDLEIELPNPMSEGKITSGQFIHPTKNDPNSYCVNDTFKKRHIQYIYADRKKNLIVKLDSNLDKQHIKKMLDPLVKVRLTPESQWVNETQVMPDEYSAHIGTYETRQFYGSRMLAETEYTGIALTMDGNRIVLKDSGRTLVKLSDRAIKIMPRSQYSEEEYKMALAVANAIYFGMMFYTSSTRTGSKATASLRPDEADVIFDVESRAKNYVRNSPHYDMQKARKAACRDIANEVIKSSQSKEQSHP